MSVVNQMLLELDRRHAPAKDRHHLPPELRPLPAPPRTLPVSGPVLAGASAALLGAALFAVWLQSRPPAPDTAVVLLPTPVAEKIMLPAGGTPVPAPASVLPPAAVAGVPPAEPPASATQIAPSQPPTPAAPTPSPVLTAQASPALPPLRPVVGNAQSGAAESPAAPAPLPVADLPPPLIEKAPPALTPRERADDVYRRALEDLELGRPAEAVLSLRQALREDARHVPARLALARLLVEQGDGQAAADLLRAGAAAGVENAEYHGLFAAVLQRSGRHEEAAAQYQAALRLMPGNGVWWMGLGLSLESAGRGPEARTAFQRALALGNLSADLVAFVEQKARQLP